MFGLFLGSLEIHMAETSRAAILVEVEKLKCNNWF